MNAPFVVVGGGLAAATVVVTLRESGYDGPLVLHSAERHLPYERPPLSKGLLADRVAVEELSVRPADWYAEHAVQLHLGSRVDTLDPGKHLIRAGGLEQPYAQLLLATGSSPRRLATADASGAPVTYLRTIEDSQRIRAALAPGARIVLIGGGFIGLEVAASAREAGAEVTVIERQELPLIQLLGRDVATSFAQLHREHGVDLRLGVGVEEVEKVGEQATIRLSDGSSVTADLAVIGVGAVPDLGLATSAGLATAGGILVDAHLRSSDPDVFAAGDVAEAEHPVLGRPIRVEHWENARAQGRVAALSMLGTDVTHTAVPYFFTDQYDLGMEYVGHAPPGEYDDVLLRGDVTGRVYTAFWTRAGRVAAAMQVNDWDATDDLRRLVGTTPDLTALRDPAVPLSDVAASEG